MEFYCVADEDGMEPCDVQCYACFKTIKDLLERNNNENIEIEDK